MAQTAIAAQVHQTLDVHRHFTAKVAFDDKLAHLFTQALQLRLGEILDLGGTDNAGSVTDFLRARTTNAINRRQRDLGMFVIRNVYPSNTGHSVTPKRKTLNAKSKRQKHQP